jgi:hypothetical protein
MVVKQVVKSRQIVKVTFEVPQAELPEGLELCEKAEALDLPFLSEYHQHPG